MPKLNVSTLLAYANVQMATEAKDLSTGMTTEQLAAALELGNKRSSIFTATQATTFANDWQVVSHEPNTNTGFSGTLFKYVGLSDPARALVKDQLVMSFRSTEFIDDAVRDNQATNSMEVRKFGWAFGQIADMRRWFESLNLGVEPLSLTGYSLGGHLATAFNQLFPGRASATYTFNGAGVGTVKPGSSLIEVIYNFDGMRTANNDLSYLFSAGPVRTFYQSLRTTLVNGNFISSAQRTELMALWPKWVAPGESAPTPVPLVSLDVGTRLLIEAFTRVDELQTEAVRIGSPPLSSGKSESLPLRPVGASLIEATNINYQIAALVAARSTSAVGIVDNAIQTFSVRQIAPGGPSANVFDVYGDTLPSAVTNSQYHYGARSPAFIEDQPLWRGTVIEEAMRV